MKTRHKHADVIHAWAEGEEIEIKHSGTGEWVPLPRNPSWAGDEYRIKPKRVKKEGWIARYRTALTSEDIFETELECSKNCPFAVGYHRIEWEEEE